MEIVRGDDVSEQPAVSARRARLINAARRSRQVARLILVIAFVLFVLTVIASWWFNYKSSQSFGNPDDAGYRFWNFVQSISYSAGFLLAAMLAALWLWLQAERTLVEADELGEAEARRHVQAQGEALIVDLERPAPPTLPPQGSADDSMWRPPDLEPADNPWQRR